MLLFGALPTLNLGGYSKDPGRGFSLLQGLQQEYGDRIGGLVRPPIPARLVGASAIFLAMGRYEEAAAIYAALTRGAPGMKGSS